eukprot:EG_transcript_10414
MGGTVLSLPWAMGQAGLVGGLLALGFWAAAADFSIYLLVMCARRSGDATYEEVAKRAFGPRMERVVVGQVIVLCWMATIGYMVLAGTMLHTVIAAVASWAGAGLPSWMGTKLSMVLVALYVLPRCFAQQLSSLRWANLFSFASVLLLGVVVAVRTIQRLNDPHAHALPIQLWPNSIEGLPYSLPLFSAAFVCHFNVLPVHAELARPTRPRLQRVLHAAIGSCLVVYVAIGTLGYLFARGDTCDNVLANFCNTDRLATVGRCALFLTLTFNLPLLVIPCRANVERALERLRGSAAEVPPDLVPLATDLPPASGGWRDGTAIRRALLTVLIVSSACLAACCVPGVAVVWTLTGSTVSLSVAFLMPCAFYLKLRAHKPWNRRTVGAAALLAVAALTAAVCTLEAVKRIVTGKSAPCPAGYDPCR